MIKLFNQDESVTTASILEDIGSIVESISKATIVSEVTVDIGDSLEDEINEVKELLSILESKEDAGNFRIKKLPRWDTGELVTVYLPSLVKYDPAKGA